MKKNTILQLRVCCSSKIWHALLMLFLVVFLISAPPMMSEGFEMEAEEPYQAISEMTEGIGNISNDKDDFEQVLYKNKGEGELNYNISNISKQGNIYSKNILETLLPGRSNVKTKFKRLGMITSILSIIYFVRKCSATILRKAGIRRLAMALGDKTDYCTKGISVAKINDNEVTTIGPEIISERYIYGYKSILNEAKRLMSQVDLLTRPTFQSRERQLTEKRNLLNRGMERLKEIVGNFSGEPAIAHFIAVTSDEAFYNYPEENVSSNPTTNEIKLLDDKMGRATNITYMSTGGSKEYEQDLILNPNNDDSDSLFFDMDLSKFTSSPGSVSLRDVGDLLMHASVQDIPIIDEGALDPALKKDFDVLKRYELYANQLSSIIEESKGKFGIFGGKKFINRISHALVATQNHIQDFKRLVAYLTFKEVIDEAQQRINVFEKELDKVACKIKEYPKAAINNLRVLGVSAIGVVNGIDVTQRFMSKMIRGKTESRLSTACMDYVINRRKSSVISKFKEDPGKTTLLKWLEAAQKALLINKLITNSRLVLLRRKLDLVAEARDQKSYERIETMNDIYKMAFTQISGLFRPLFSVNFTDVESLEEAQRVMNICLEVETNLIASGFGEDFEIMKRRRSRVGSIKSPLDLSLNKSGHDKNSGVDNKKLKNLIDSGGSKPSTVLLNLDTDSMTIDSEDVHRRRPTLRLINTVRRNKARSSVIGLGRVNSERGSRPSRKYPDIREHFDIKAPKVEEKIITPMAPGVGGGDFNKDEKVTNISKGNNISVEAPKDISENNEEQQRGRSRSVSTKRGPRPRSSSRLRDDTPINNLVKISLDYLPQILHSADLREAFLYEGKRASELKNFHSKFNSDLISIFTKLRNMLEVKLSYFYSNIKTILAHMEDLKNMGKIEIRTGSEEPSPAEIIDGNVGHSRKTINIINEIVDDFATLLATVKREKIFDHSNSNFYEIEKAVYDLKINISSVDANYSQFNYIQSYVDILLDVKNITDILERAGIDKDVLDDSNKRHILTNIEAMRNHIKLLKRSAPYVIHKSINDSSMSTEYIEYFQNMTEKLDVVANLCYKAIDEGVNGDIRRGLITHIRSFDTKMKSS